MTRVNTMDANLPAGYGLVGTIAAWIAALFTGLLAWRISAARKEGRDEANAVNSNERDEGLRQDLLEVRDDLRSGIAELRTLTIATARRDGAQDVINKVSADTLSGIVTRLDAHEKVHSRIDTTLSEHSGTLKLMAELLERRSQKTGMDGSL